jgi:hypothetical protein
MKGPRYGGVLFHVRTDAYVSITLGDIVPAPAYIAGQRDGEMMTLENVYHNLLRLQGEHSADAVLQLEIYQYAAERHERVDLLVALALHPQVSDEVDVLLSRSNELEVRQAWASRPGRDPAQLAAHLRLERRTSVILPLAHRPDLDPLIYRVLAESRSSKVAFALAANQHVPLDVREASVRRYVSHSPQGTWARAVERLVDVCSADSSNSQAMWEAAADTLMAPYVFACLTRTHVRESDVERWVSQLVVICDAADGRWRGLLGNIIETIGRRTLTLTVRAEMLAHADQLLKREAGGTSGEAEPWHAALRVGVERVRALDDQLQRAVERFENDPDPDSARTRLSVLMARYRETSAVDAVLHSAGRHLGVPAREVYTLMLERDLMLSGALVARLAREGNHGIVTDLFEESYSSMYTPWFLAYLDKPDTTTRAYLEAVSASGRLWPDWSIHVIVDGGYLEAVLDKIRWAAVAQIADHPGVAVLIRQALQRELGDDHQRWEAFRVLAENFEGSLADLLTAARALTD